MASEPSPSNSSPSGSQQTPNSPTITTPSNPNSGQDSGGQSYAARIIEAIAGGRFEGRTIVSPAIAIIPHSKDQ